MSEDLRKQAQGKLSQARTLIKEAGELAKEGQFFLHFGEIGIFIPRSAMDRTSMRASALSELTSDGRFNGYDRTTNLEKPRTPLSELSPDEVECALDELVDSMLEDSEVPHDFREYCNASDADRWWHPSRC